MTFVPAPTASDCGEGVVRVLGEGRPVTADRILGGVGDVLDRGRAAADVDQFDETAEVSLDDLGVGAVGALAAVTRHFEDFARGLDDSGGVGVVEGDPLVLIGRRGGLGFTDHRDPSPGGKSRG